MGGGLIFAVLFRVTKSIYWPIGLHIVYNGIGQLFDVTVILVVSSYRGLSLGKDSHLNLKRSCDESISSK